MTHYWPSTLPGRLQAQFNEISINKKTNSKYSSVHLVRISISVVGVQVVLGTEGLPWAFFWRRFHCGPLISVCNLPNIWTHPALLSLPSHWKALHWVLWEPYEDSEERLQVSVTDQRLKTSFQNIWVLWCSSRILEYLQAMRNYFLLEAGDTMYDFYTAIFDKVQEKESWQQPSFLSVQLQEAVGQRHSEDSSRYNLLTILHVDTI